MGMGRIMDERVTSTSGRTEGSARAWRILRPLLLGRPLVAAVALPVGLLMRPDLVGHPSRFVLIALVLAVPTSIGIALATTVFLPRRMRGPIGGFINLLAAVPSVIFGLWGVTVLVPFLRPVLEWMAETLGGISIFGWMIFAGPVTSGSFLVAGLVLGIMILPIVTAITREVLLTVPRDQQEAAYALGATRWEMVKHSMLPWARSGIVGASALGLGRAVGETIAIAMLLGNSPVIFGSLLGREPLSPPPSPCRPARPAACSCPPSPRWPCATASCRPPST